MKMITILGPTASGKTLLATALAANMHGEIISADSRQVYRGMDIGTGKDLADYFHQGIQIPYHLIDIVDAGKKYNLFQYQRDFHVAYKDIIRRKVQPILCGGTGLYIEAVLKGYSLSPVPQNPLLREQLASLNLEQLTKILIDMKQRNGVAMHNKSDIDTTQRAIRAIEIETFTANQPTPERILPPINSCIFGVDINREERRKKITNRLKERLENGMIEEVQGLLDKGIAAEDLEYYGLEYKFVTEYVTRKISFKDMFKALEIAIHQFAKRQMTWFRGMERRGFSIHWLDASLTMEQKINQMKEIYGE